MNESLPHGGNVYAAAHASGRPLNRFHDFSASINPLGPSPRALRAVVAALPLAIHYPDPDCLTLRQALGERWELAPELFVIGNGSSELIQVLPRALGIRHAVIAGPTFSEYARAVALAGGRVSRVDASRTERYRPPIGRVVRRLQKTDRRAATGRTTTEAVFLCNPNSPTGQAVPADEVLQLIRVASDAGIWVVVDETFVEYCEERSVLPKAALFPRCLVLRSFTKFYALPGFRAGYLVGSKEVVARICEHLPPWSVNTLAQAAALAALHDRRHARASLAFVKRERLRLAEGLAAIPGVTVYPSEANFLLVELPAFTPAGQAAELLRREGLLIRDCSAMAGLNDRTVRVAVRTERENRRLLAALRRLLRSHE